MAHFRLLASLMAAGVLTLSLVSCAHPPEEKMTPEQARQLLEKTVRDSTTLVPIEGWAALHGATPMGCQAGGAEGVKFSYGISAPQPGRDHQADARTVSDYWASLGIRVQTVLTNGEPDVYGQGGPVQSISFNTASPGDYYISGTSVCVPGNAKEELAKLNQG